MRSGNSRSGSRHYSTDRNMLIQDVLHETMPPYREEDSVVYRRRRRTTPISSSPEPYREKRRSRERRRAYSQGGESRSREGNRHTRRYSRSHERSIRERSCSPRRRLDRRYHDEKRHRSSRREEDEYEEHRSKRRHISSPQSSSRCRKHGEDDKLISVKGSTPLPSQKDAFKGNSMTVGSGTPAREKQKPNLSATGRLAAESNTIKSSDGQAIVLKYHEPVEARKPPPSQAWRMYVFKGSEIMDTVELSQRSSWLFGREAAVVDFLVEHPSCSKQHAVVQFRYAEKRNEFGDKTGKVNPYLIDLESANGTSMNGEEVPAGRYLELRDKDVLKFGHSTREYVLQLPPK